MILIEELKIVFIQKLEHLYIVDEQKVENLEQAANAADDDALTLKV